MPFVTESSAMILVVDEGDRTLPLPAGTTRGPPTQPGIGHATTLMCPMHSLLMVRSGQLGMEKRATEGAKSVMTTGVSRQR
jgi:hypothetical protein